MIRRRHLVIPARVLMAAGALLASSARAAAQEAPEPAAPSPAPATAEARDDAAWAAYHQAFRALLMGDRAGAVAALGRIQVAYPGHPAAQHAASLLRVLRAPAPGTELPPAPEEADQAQRPTRGARAELIIFQTLHGVVAGAELCALLDCQGARSNALALMAGGGLGFGLSFLGSARGVTPGQVELLDTGTAWGAWNGFELTLITNQTADTSHVWRNLLIGQGSGLAVGGLLWYPLRPTAGQVALASTFGAWGTALTALALAAVPSGMTEAHLWTPLLVAGDLGLVAGAAVARDSNVSRGHTLLIDAGGVLGLLVGALIGSGSNSTQNLARVAFAGTAVGLGIAAYASRDWDAPSSNVRVAAMPLPGGGVLAGIGGRF